MTLLVSYWTEGTGYEEEAKGLAESCEKQKVPFRIESVPNLGSWIRNTQYKPTFLLEVMEERREPLLWVDADARIQKPLDLSFLGDDHDFAAHWKRGHELLSGTLWFNFTAPAIELLGAWKDACAAHDGSGRGFDQRILNAVVPTVPSLRTYKLPPEYTFIFDIMRRELPNVEPIIEHFQASRRLRRTIK